MRVGDLPSLGVGIGYRNELRAFYEEHGEEIEWYELVADRYFNALPESSDWLVEFREAQRLVPHGLDLSLGTDDEIDPVYSRQAAELCRLVRAPFYSDHLCMTHAGGVELGHLTPLPFSRRAARRVAEKAKAMQDLLGVPLLLENIAYSFALPGEMSEVEFVSSVVEQADCGILLDLTNLFVNSQNHGYDPHDYLRRLPLERVVQVHLAGSERHHHKWVDSHSQSVEAHPEVWSLLEFVVKHSSVRGVLLERDQNFPDDPAELIADLRRAREIFRGARTVVAPPRDAIEVRTSPGGPSPSPPPSSPSSPSSIDLLPFQSVLARVLVDRGARRRLAGDADAFAREVGLDTEAIRSLQAAGLSELDDFASSLETKRFGMVSRSSPALYKLLETSSTLDHVRQQFATRCPPNAAPEYPNRTIRDAYWAQALVRALVAEGDAALASVPHLDDVAHFEQVLLDLGMNRTRVESAKLFQAQRDAWTALPRAAVLRRFPRSGPHVAIEAFSCEVTSVVRALMDGTRIPSTVRRATRVLFVKQVGARNVRYFEINALTDRLLARCDGQRSGGELADELARQSPAFAGTGGRDKVAAILGQLVQQNVLALDPAFTT